MSEDKSYVDLLTEVETLKLAVEQYRPYFDKHLASIKRAELAKYGITDEEEIALYSEKYLTSEQDENIALQAKALAEELRLNEKPAYTDPSLERRGGHAVYRGSGSVREHLYDVGRQAVKQAYSRHNPARSSIKAEVKPAPVTDHQRKQNILARLFGR